ncbi:unnamed protein product [Acanthoscelides obtectus]|uniref:Uncharacterized protein n=1 Tax=Acanthoscelides obtectus TaxID=200917 RepID=A0A9P0M1M7_ACAOB|nr:unnamed protein product [Acanthoscelides obtectus]CAK1680562.1 hypothetical protein AOBTE_LOCUS32762 [Acanthoscelides obtectus]
MMMLIGSCRLERVWRSACVNCEFSRVKMFVGGRRHVAKCSPISKNAHGVYFYISK